MSLEKLKEEISHEVAHWAKSQGLPAPESLAFTAAPAHVGAELSLPWPLQAAKTTRKNPLEIARALASDLAHKVPGVDSVQSSAPGFVNFHLTTKFLCDNLLRLQMRPAEYGANPTAKKRSILIEFVSANPTGPSNLPSGRAASMGDSLARILKRIGHKVGTEYYVNDAGRQIELLGRSVEARYLEMHGKPVELPADGYQGEYIKDIASAAPAQAAGWKAADFSRFAVERMLNQQKRDMEDFGIHFDRWFRESELHQSKAVEQTLEYLKKNGMARTFEGATWLVLPNELASMGLIGENASDTANLDDKERVLVRSDGRPTYFLADIAYHKNKYDRGWDELVDIWGADHHGYVPRMKTAMAALGKKPSSFHPIIHQLVHLYRGKELVKMSKRAGELISLRELLDEVGRDACRFFFAMRGPNVHMNFDMELAKKQSQENPVYYVQYVHARIRSVFRESAKTGLPAHPPESMNGLSSLLVHPNERALLVKLAWFPETLSACEGTLSPHPLTTYLMDLAGIFHAFYEQCRVVDAANESLTKARLSLCDGVGAVIKEGLSLLGVSAPEQM